MKKAHAASQPPLPKPAPPAPIPQPPVDPGSVRHIPTVLFAQESKAPFPPTHLFMKSNGAQQNPGDRLSCDSSACDQVDYECELAVPRCKFPRG